MADVKTEVFEYKLSLSAPEKSMVIRALTNKDDNADSIKIPLENINGTKGLVDFFNTKTVPIVSGHSVEPDAKFGRLYWLNGTGIEDGLYYLPPKPATSADHILIISKSLVFIRTTFVDTYVDMLNIPGVNPGDRVIVQKDPIIENNGEWLALETILTTASTNPIDWEQLSKPVSTERDLGSAADETFDPSTSPPTGGYKDGDYYTAGVDGDYLHFEPPTGGLIGVKKDDKLIWNGSEWAIGLTGVTSVFGRTGIITAQVDDYDIPKITGLQDALDGKISVIIDKGEANLGTPSPISPVLGDTYTVTWAGDYVNFKPSIPDPLIAEVDDRLYWDGKNWIILDAATKDWVNKKFGRFTFLNTLAGQKDSVQVDSVDMFTRTTTDDQYKRTKDTKLLMRDNRLFLYSGEDGKTEKAQISVASAGAVAISVTDKTGTRYNTSFVGRKVLFSSLTIAEIDSTDPGNEKSAVTKEWVEQRAMDGGTY